MKTQNITIPGIALLLAFTCFSPLAQAADPAPAPALKKRVVNYDDLNVTGAQGAQRLYHRIAAAAQHVCGGDERPRALADQIRVSTCMARSIDRAVAAVNQPALTALAATKSGRIAPNMVLADRR